MIAVLLVLALAGPVRAESPDRSPDAAPSGMPAPGRAWLAADYETALAALSTAPADQLPRVGGASFQRMVAQDNLSVDGPVATMMDEAMRIGPAHSRILMLYLQALTGGQPLEAEVLGLMGFSLRWTVRQWQVLDAYLANQPADFLEDPARAAGFDQVRGGTATTLAGALTTLEQPEGWPEEALASFASELSEALPELLPRLGESEQAEVRRRLAALLEALPQGRIRAALEPAGAP